MTEKDLGQIIPDILATATVDNKVGEPAVNVTVEQINEVNRLERKFNFEFVNMKGEKGDTPVKGVDYLTEEEKQQFTTETLSLVTAEGAKQVKAVTDKASEQISKVSSQGNDQISLVSAEGQKVVEQVKKLIGVNPAGGDAVSVGGKTRIEFEKDTQALAGKYNGNFPLTSAVKDAVYLVPTTGKFYICNESYSGKSLSEPNENFEELSVFKTFDKLEKLKGNFKNELLQSYKEIIHEFSNEGYIRVIDGKLDNTSNAQNTGFISVSNFVKVYCSGKIASSGYLLALYNANKEIIPSLSIAGTATGQNVTIDMTDSKYNNVKYIVCSNYGDFEKKLILTGIDKEIEKKANEALIKSNQALDKSIEPITLEKTTFFNFNFGIPKLVTIDRNYVDFGGKIAKGGTSAIINVEPSTRYFFYAPNRTRNNICELNSYDDFVLGNNYKLINSNLVNYNGMNVIEFTTSKDAKKVFIYFNDSSSYNYELYKNDFIICKNSWSPSEFNTIDKKYIPSSLKPLEGTKILIFGDSITDCCSIEINDLKQTTKHVWVSPSNSFIDKNGERIEYDMWPKILNDTQNALEIRNYAKAGASYKTSQRSAGNERQNLHYQIDVAMNDLNNPNNVFNVSNFAPDIVIFALGINDGLTPNDTYSAAISKDASFLDEKLFNESVRKAFLRIKNKFPLAQIFVSLPIQRANNDVPNSQMYKDLKRMANRYSCIIIDGSNDFGIINDNEIDGDVGIYLKDGLHPNDKGQKLMARGIIKALDSNFMKV